MQIEFENLTEEFVKRNIDNLYCKIDDVSTITEIINNMG